jgi:hypothetical protein
MWPQDEEQFLQMSLLLTKYNFCVHVCLLLLAEKARNIVFEYKGKFVSVLN